MSLINDALKRAQQAPPRPPAGPVPNPHLQPAQPSRGGLKGLGLGVPLALAGCALLLLVFYWRVSNREVQARSEAPPAPAAATVAQQPTPAAQPEPAPAPPKPAPSAQPAPVAASATVPPAENAQAAAGSNATVVAEAAPKPVLPRLQGIIYNPSRPSAVLSGHTLFVGEHLGPFRLVAVTHDSATLVGGGETNLLTLEP